MGQLEDSADQRNLTVERMINDRIHVKHWLFSAVPGFSARVQQIRQYKAVLAFRGYNVDLQTLFC